MEKYFSNKDYRMLYYDSFFKTFANSIYAVFTPVILYKAGVSITMINIYIYGTIPCYGNIFTTCSNTIKNNRSSKYKIFKLHIKEHKSIACANS